MTTAKQDTETSVSDDPALDYVLDQFDKVGVLRVGTEITLDQQFTGSTQLTTMFMDCLATETFTIKLSSWQTSDDQSSLTLIGTSTILNVENMGVTLTASTVNGSLHLCIELTPPGKYTFSTILPDMPVQKTGSPKDELEGGMTTFLDKLSFATRTLIFTNQAMEYGPNKEKLVSGLNLVAELYFTGILYELSVLTGSEGPISIAGPLVEFRTVSDPLAFLGIRLDRPLALAADQLSDTLPINNPRLHIKSPLYPGQVDHSIDFMRQAGVYLLADMDFFGQSWQMIGRVGETGGDIELSLFGRNTGSSLGGLSKLTTNMSGMEDVDFSQHLPADMPSTGSIQITEVGCTYNVTKKSVQYLNFGVGMDVGWTLIKDVLSVDEVGASLSVQHPFDKRSRQLGVTLSASLDIKGSKLVGFASLPNYDFGGGLAPEQTLPLGDLVESFSSKPMNLPALTIQELYVAASPKEKTFAFECVINDVVSVPVGQSSFDVKNIDFVMHYDKTEGLTGAFSANMTVASACAVLSAQLDTQFTLSGSLFNVDFRTFWRQVNPGHDLPAEMPDLIFNFLTLSVAPQEGDFSVSGKASVNWDKLPFGQSLDTQVEFSFAVDRTKGQKAATTARMSLVGSGEVDFGEGFALKQFNFVFDYNSHSGWSLSGSAAVAMLDTELTLNAAYKDTTKGQLFTLTAIASPEQSLLHMAGVASYSFHQFDVMIDRRAVEGGPDLTFWSLRLDSTLAIDNVLTVGGYLSLYDKDDGSKGLMFNPKEGTATAKIPLPEELSLSLGVFGVGIVREAGSSGWCFNATVDMALQDGPHWLGQILPSKLRANLVVGQKDSRISALKVTDVLDLTLPHAGGKPMGTLYFQLLELGIDLRPNVGLMFTTGMGFSQEVNAFLGAGSLFRVYQAGDANSLARTRFTVSENGIEVDIITSPFAGANAVVINNESWIDADFGECGAMQFKLPTFKYDAVSQYFEGGSGVKVTRPLAIPLTPLKELLKAVKLNAAAKVFPDVIPIKSVKVVDDQGDFKIDELIHLLEGAGDIPGEIKSVLREVGDLLDRFPDTFKQYFNITIPEALTFKFGFSPSGRVTLDLRTGETPIRVLQPAMVQGIVPMPGLVGMEVRRISIGTIASGSLFQATVDGHIDSYDMATLAVSLMLPTNENFPLPTSDELQRRVILNNLFMIIPLQQGVPIPIPVFFDQLGLEYMGIEGVGLQGHVGFPQPKLSASGAVAFYQSFSEFFSDRSYLLDPKNPPGNIDLELKLNNNFVQLPEYLGGKVLGMKDSPVAISLWRYLAHGLNFFKTLSLNEMIQSIPIEHRVGSAAQSFLFMEFDADWLITTPNEFKQGAFAQLKLSDSDKQDFIDVLPAVQIAAQKVSGDKEEGLVVFLRGEADIKVIRLEVVFGLAASGSMGFSTGFKFTGELARIIEVELGGALAVNAPKVSNNTHVEKAAPVLISARHSSSLPRGVPLAMHFDGESSITLYDTGAHNFSGAFTVEAWINVDRFDKTWQAIITKGDSSWRVHRYGNSQKIAFGTSGLSNVDLPSKQDIYTGQWVHVAAVYTGKQKRLYINGQLDNAVSVTGQLTTNTFPTVIGDNAEAKGRPFVGSMTEVRLWKQGRSANNILHTMNVKVADNARNLVSCYRFSQYYGYTAVDQTGQVPGVMHSPNWVVSDLLLLDGLQLDGGKQSYASVTDGSAFTMNKAFSVECWIKVDAFNKNWQAIVTKGDSSWRVHRYRNTQKIAFGTSGLSNGDLPSKQDIPLNTWTHVAAVYDGKTKSLYINGKLDNSAATTGTLGSNNYALSVGHNAQRPGREFKGAIDDVRLWSTARSAQAINQNAMRLLTGKEAGLVAAWSFQRGFGQQADDLCGQHPLQLNNSVWRVARDRENVPVVSGIVLGEAANSTVRVRQLNGFPTAAFTLECWVMPGANPHNGCLVSVVGAGDKGFALLNPNNLTVYINGRASAPTGVGLQQGRWQHLALSWEASSGKFQIFIDGTLTKQLTHAAGQALPKSGDWAFGQEQSTAGEFVNNKGFVGRLAHCRLWSGVRDQKAMAQTMLATVDASSQGLVALWPLEAGGGDTVNELVHQADGMAQAVQWPVRRHLVPKGLLFDGTSSALEAQASDHHNLTAYTAECWFRADKPTQTWTGLLGKPGRNFNIWLHESGYIHHRFHTTTNTNAGAPNTPTGTVNWNTWMHVAITNDGKVACTYVNGELVAKGASDTLLPDNTPFIVGRNLDGKKSNFFKGAIDEVRVWSIAHTQEDIQRTMHRPLVGYEPGLTLYWSMEAGSGERIVDRTGNGNVGLIQGAQWNMTKAPVAQADADTAAFQLWGHCHLKLLDHAIFTGDVRVVDTDFWFQGKLALFPSKWPIAVNGNVEGSIGKNHFLLTGDVNTELFGLPLLTAHTRISDSGVSIHSLLFGAQLALDVQKENKGVRIKGGVGYQKDASLDFGPIRIAGVKVADNVRISVSLDIGLAVDISQEKLALGIKAAFSINGIGFDIHFTLSVSPADIAAMVKSIVKKIVAEPMKYLEHMFSDAAKWLEDVGKGVIEFADDVGKELGKALKALKAPAEDVAKLLDNAGYEVEKIGNALASGFNQGAEDVAKALKDVGKTAEDVGHALKNTFNSSTKQAAKALKDVGYVAEDVGKALSKTFTRDAQEAAKALKAAGYAIEDVGKGLEKGFNQGAKEVAKTLKDIGQGAEDVGKALKHVFNTGTEDAAKFLKGAGFVANDVGKALQKSFTKDAKAAANAMKNAGYIAEDIGKGLASGFKQGANDVAKTLKGIGHGAESIGKSLKSVFNTGTNDAAKVLRGAGFNAKQVGDGLRKVFTSNGNVAASALKYAGFGANDVGSALNSAFGLSANAAGLALNAAGFGVNQVGQVLRTTFKQPANSVANFMKNSLKLNDKTVNSALKGAGFAANQVAGAMKSAFNWTENAGKTIAKTAEKVFNPSKW